MAIMATIMVAYLKEKGKRSVLVFISGDNYGGNYGDNYGGIAKG